MDFFHLVKESLLKKSLSLKKEVCLKRKERLTRKFEDIYREGSHKIYLV